MVQVTTRAFGMCVKWARPRTMVGLPFSPTISCPLRLWLAMMSFNDCVFTLKNPGGGGCEGRESERQIVCKAHECVWFPQLLVQVDGFVLHQLHRAQASRGKHKSLRMTRHRVTDAPAAGAAGAAVGHQQRPPEQLLGTLAAVVADRQEQIAKRCQGIANRRASRRRGSG